MKTTHCFWHRALILPLFAVSASDAADLPFTNVTPDSDYSTTTNWTGSAVPTGSDNALIGTGSYTPTPAVHCSSSSHITSGSATGTSAVSISSGAAIDNSAWSSLGTSGTNSSGNDVNLEWTAIPEPSIGMAFLLGITGLLRRNRKRWTCD